MNDGEILLVTDSLSVLRVFFVYAFLKSLPHITFLAEQMHNNVWVFKVELPSLEQARSENLFTLIYSGLDFDRDSAFDALCPDRDCLYFHSTHNQNSVRVIKQVSPKVGLSRNNFMIYFGFFNPRNKT